MEENIYVFIGLIVALFVLFFPAKIGGGKNTAKSELHVRDRYEVAEMIKKQWEEKNKS